LEMFLTKNQSLLTLDLFEYLFTPTS
jgi:hypothetical protein